ncbi:MAG: ATPase [Pseudomonadota bacterium]|nr:ATPase [Pseudomonadota bacterium]
MNEPSWNASIKQAQVNMQAPVLKRFYERAQAGEADGGFALLLDGRPTRTPAKAKLIAPTRALAEAMAREWQAQGETIQPATMPLTRLANSALDGVAQAMAATAAEIAGFAGADLVCYRALEPEALAARQAAAFDPVLAFAQAALGARFVLAGGIVHVPQPEASLAAVRAAVETYADPFALTALHGLTSLSGSVLIALAVARGAMPAASAWGAAHVDEDFQIQQWGADDEATLRRAAREKEFAAAAFTLDALRRP